MNNLTDRADLVLEWLLSTSWQLAALVLIVLALQRLCARWLTPRWRYALWLIVVVRLVVPLQPAVSLPAVDWSLAGSLPGIASEATLSESEQPGLLHTSSWPDTRASSDKEVELPPLLSLEPRPNRGPRIKDRPAGLVALETTGATRPVATHGSEANPWALLIIGAWIALAVALALRDLLRERAFRKQLARADRVDDPRLVGLLESCRVVARYPRPVELVSTDLVASPAATGHLHPKILVPRELLTELDSADLRHVFLHELAHLKSWDVPLNVLLCALKNLWWFHPLVHLALRQLGDARESARDWEALRLASDSTPVPYAKTLLRLVDSCPPSGDRTATAHSAPTVGFLQGEPNLKRRILMITRFGQSRRSGTVIGAALVVGLGWTALTRAASVPLEPGTPASASAQQLESVKVERQSQPVPWREALKRKLETRLDFDLEDIRVEDAARWLSENTGINFVMGEQYDTDYDSERISLHAKDMSVREFLDLLPDLEQDWQDIDWCMHREAIVIDSGHDVPRAVDLRFYQIDKLLEGHDDIDDVITVVQELTHLYGGWERDGVQIDYWRGLLVVAQTDEMHERTQKALDLMLNRGRSAPEPAPHWEARLRELLDQKVDLVYGEQDLGKIARSFARKYEIPLAFPGPNVDVFTASFDLRGITVRAALDWIVEATDGRLVLDINNGVFVFTEARQPEFEFFEVEDLATSRPGHEDGSVADGLENMIRDHIAPASWDENPWNQMFYWRGMLIVGQSRPVLRAIQDLLDAARRASEG